MKQLVFFDLTFQTELLAIMTTLKVRGCAIFLIFAAHRSTLAAVEHRRQREAEETERELNEKVNAATVEQLTHKFNLDFEALKARVPGQAQVAKEAALDAKYLAQRQLLLGCSTGFWN